MSLTPPSCEDTPIWDAWLAAYQMPALAAADEVGLFDAVDQAPADAGELAGRLGLKVEALRALLPMMAALGFLRVRLGRYQLTPTSRTYLLRDGRFYWGHAFSLHRELEWTRRFAASLRGRNPNPDSDEGPRPLDAWESGQMPPEMAAGITAFMNSHSVPAAIALAQQDLLGWPKRLLDVGGGSGCFSIALAAARPSLRATIMELQPICDLADRYIADAGLSDRVDTRAVDMFRMPWPEGYDAIFMSNIFHDWDPETNARLAASAFKALPSGGRIHLHEMLINDEGSGPLAPAAFSMMMLLGTKGRQYSLAEHAATLTGAGFRDVKARDSYGYFSVVTAVKP